MRAIILEKNFMPDPTEMITNIVLYASGGKGKELANPKTDVKPTIDIRYCSRVDLDKPLIYHISSLDIDFTKRSSTSLTRGLRDWKVHFEKTH
jgi:hypothetical protein